jgi:hypothetical protein
MGPQGRSSRATLRRMGLFRKTTSVFSLGAVDFRSAKDRTAAHSAATKRQAKKQTKILKKIEKQGR